VHATPTDLSLRACRAQSLYARACNSLEEVNSYTTPTDISLRECRAQSLYGRACNSLSLRINAQRNPNAVHAAS
jgi:hypothetical protein